MKDDRAIQDRIRALLDEEFQARVDASQERLPVCCTYNHRQTLDTRKTVFGEENTRYNRITRGDGRRGLPVVQTIGLCMFGSEDPTSWPGTICEDPVDAKRCPPQAFTPRVSPVQVRTDFETQIKDLDWVKNNLPEVSTLLWVLGDEELPEAVSPDLQSGPEPLPSEPSLPPVTLSWWARTLLWLAGLSRHRLLPPHRD